LEEDAEQTNVVLADSKSACRLVPWRPEFVFAVRVRSIRAFDRHEVPTTIVGGTIGMKNPKCWPGRSMSVTIFWPTEGVVGALANQVESESNRIDEISAGTLRRAFAVFVPTKQHGLIKLAADRTKIAGPRSQHRPNSFSSKRAVSFPRQDPPWDHWNNASQKRPDAI